MFLPALLILSTQAVATPLASPTPSPSPSQSVAARPNPMTLGPAVGATLLPFEAKDQNGVLRTLESLKGPNGLVLVFFRSADW